VVITHSNLAHNLRMIEQSFGLTPGSRGISWLPHFHDMGLFSGFIAPIVCSGDSVFMSPDAFLRRPLRWLEAISHYRGQVAGAPNFAYDLCSRSAARGELPPLDLSTWRTAFVGAEPVRCSTMQTFAERFRSSGFRTSALTPCYGMAEATVLVSCTPPHKMAALHRLSRKAMEAGQAKPSTKPAALVLMGSGDPAAETNIRIVDPTLRIPLGSRRVGEIWVSGPQVARGYWCKNDDVFNATLADSAEGPFLRTGDLGFLTETGELVFVERLKNIIVYNGQKYACHDLELTAGISHQALSPDNCVAISFDFDEKPHLVVIAELPRCAVGQVDEAARAIRSAWFTTHGLPARTIAFVPWGSLSRTTSGKLQRRLNASRLISGGMRVFALDGDALPQPDTIPDETDNIGGLERK
jgi:acyl-CoA synthetase (AMP-forming)/AMP-acid ligase II